MRKCPSCGEPLLNAWKRWNPKHPIAKGLKALGVSSIRGVFKKKPDKCASCPYKTVVDQKQIPIGIVDYAPEKPPDHSNYDSNNIRVYNQWNMRRAEEKADEEYGSGDDMG